MCPRRITISRSYHCNGLLQELFIWYSNAMRKTHFIALLVITALCAASCATRVINIPQELSPAELIQRAQEASDRNRYKLAHQYYTALLERNSTNIDLVCTAEYEIAFIYYKQKKFSQAKEGFQLLLERYESLGGDELPPQFRRLSIIVLERISEKEAPRTRKKKKAEKSDDAFDISLLREDHSMQFNPELGRFPVYHLL